jgi:hypothetical protein
MNLVEVMVASTVFATASGSSLQIWAASAGTSQQGVQRQQVLERMEIDWLRLQAQWRQAAPAEGALNQSCQEAAAEMVALAQRVPVPPQVRRQLEPSADGRALLVRLQSQEPAVERQRLFSPALYGFCGDPAPVAEGMG